MENARVDATTDVKVQKNPPTIHVPTGNNKTLKSDKLNAIKEALYKERKNNKLLPSSEELWLKNCIRLQKELEFALIRVEGVPQPHFLTPSSPAFRSNDSMLGCIPKGKQPMQSRTKAELVQNGLLLSLRY